MTMKLNELFMCLTYKEDVVHVQGSSHSTLLCYSDFQSLDRLAIISIAPELQKEQNLILLSCPS